MPEEIEMDTQVQLLDSEVVEIGKVAAKLNRFRNTHTNLESFGREVQERFAEIGLLVRVGLKPLHYGGETVYGIVLTIMDHIGDEDSKPFDHEKMGHEVRSNIRGLDQPDVAPSPKVGMPGRGALWTPKGS